MNPEPDKQVPAIELGTMVEVCPDESMRNTSFGFVVAANNGMPHVLAFQITDTHVRFPGFQYCLHINDPSLESNKNEIRADELRGVYRLAQPELRVRAFNKQYDDLKEEHAKLLDRMDEMQKTIAQLRDDVADLQEIARRAGTLARIEEEEEPVSRRHAGRTRK